MKKVFLFAAVASAFSLASCKKDYTCACTENLFNTTAKTTIHDTKKKATDACEAGSSSAYGITVTCKIQ